MGQGRWVDPKGYVWVKAPKGHPNATGKSGWIMEHVLVMSELLGRPLRKGEQVHHRNLIKSDNHPKNLELWTTNQPTGARVSDMLAWCHLFIEQYQDAPESIVRPDDGLVSASMQGVKPSSEELPSAVYALRFTAMGTMDDGTSIGMANPTVK